MQLVKRALILGIIETIWLFGAFSIISNINTITPLATVRWAVGLLGFLILFIGIYFSIRNAAKNSEVFTYGKAVKTGILISVMVAVIVSLASAIYIIIVPSYPDDMITEATQALKKSNLSAEEMNNRIAGIKAQFSKPAIIASPLIAQSVLGIAFSFIVSIFLRKKR